VKVIDKALAQPDDPMFREPWTVSRLSEGTDRRLLNPRDLL
jgi:hypothetical protein